MLTLLNNHLAMSLKVVYNQRGNFVYSINGGNPERRIKSRDAK